MEGMMLSMVWRRAHVEAEFQTRRRFCESITSMLTYIREVNAHNWSTGEQTPPRPAFGKADHISVLLLQEYKKTQTGKTSPDTTGIQSD